METEINSIFFYYNQKTFFFSVDDFRICAFLLTVKAKKKTFFIFHSTKLNNSLLIMLFIRFFSIICRFYVKMTVSSGYENKAYDGDNPVKVCIVCLYWIKNTNFLKRKYKRKRNVRDDWIFFFIWFHLQPPLRNTEDTVSIREKVKLSPGEKWRILKNVAILSCAFMIQFTAFQVNIFHINVMPSIKWLKWSTNKFTCDWDDYNEILRATNKKYGNYLFKPNAFQLGKKEKVMERKWNEVILWCFVRKQKKKQNSFRRLLLLSS